VKALGPLALVLAIVVAVLVGYQAVVLTQRLDVIAQRLDSATQQLGELSGLRDRVDSAGQQLDALGSRLDGVGQRVDDVSGRVDDVGSRVDAMATDVANVAQFFEEFPIGPFPSGSPPAAIQADLGEAVDIDSGDEFSQLSGRYTVLSAERLANDVEVLVRWEATVGPLATGYAAYGWSAYDDARVQYGVDAYDEDVPDGGFPSLPVLAAGRTHQGSMYVRGAAGADHLWLELMDFSFTSPLLTVQLW
jgi:hypothetical protein